MARLSRDLDNRLIYKSYINRHCHCRSPFVITTNLFGAAHLSGLREREQRGQAVQCNGAIAVAPLARVASTVDDVKQAGQ